MYPLSRSRFSEPVVLLQEKRFQEWEARKGRNELVYAGARDARFRPPLSGSLRQTFVKSATMLPVVYVASHSTSNQAACRRGRSFRLVSVASIWISQRYRLLNIDLVPLSRLHLL